MIPFNKPALTEREGEFIAQALKSDKISGDGPFGRLCEDWFVNFLGCKKTLLTPSCTAALEMCAILIDVKPGDEVIMPSFTFVSTANAFLIRGAKIVFVDIRADTMNIDEAKIEKAITSRTKAIVAVHYAGVACEMDEIMKIADKYGISVIEDAAQGMMSKYKGKALGTIGHLGTYSFHETKNFTSGGEGGLLIINSDEFGERAEIIREKGTNRSSFFRGQTDKYTWVDIGSSFLLSELNAAYLWGQLEVADDITNCRLELWKRYKNAFSILADKCHLDLPTVPLGCEHNGHIFYLKFRDLTERSKYIDFMHNSGVIVVFHYVPLHSSPAGKKYGHFSGLDENTTSESERLVRLPLFYGMSEASQSQVINKTFEFFDTLRMGGS